MRELGATPFLACDRGSAGQVFGIMKLPGNGTKETTAPDAGALDESNQAMVRVKRELVPRFWQKIQPTLARSKGEKRQPNQT
jgi:hypothetical protein